jgi:hypothetical protein
MKGRMHVIMSHTNLKCAQKGNGLELLTFITSNKNG